MAENSERMIEWEELTEDGPKLVSRPASEVTRDELQRATEYLTRRVELRREEYVQRLERLVKVQAERLKNMAG